MRYTQLAGIGDVSVVCLGTMTWGNQNTEEEAHAQLDAFISAGGNFADTAGALSRCSARRCKR